VIEGVVEIGAQPQAAGLSEKWQGKRTAQ
jgi:hypothetical protein